MQGLHKNIENWQCGGCEGSPLLRIAQAASPLLVLQEPAATPGATSEGLVAAACQAVAPLAGCCPNPETHPRQRPRQVASSGLHLPAPTPPPCAAAPSDSAAARQAAKSCPRQPPLAAAAAWRRQFPRRQAAQDPLVASEAPRRRKARCWPLSQRGWQLRRHHQRVVLRQRKVGTGLGALSLRKAARRWLLPWVAR
jgi:hypothetical protein